MKTALITGMSGQDGTYLAELLAGKVLAPSIGFFGRHFAGLVRQ